MTNGKSLPKEVIDLWPEIFEEIEMNVVPLNYVHLVEITFQNGKVWELDLKKSVKTRSWDDFRQELKSIIKTYEDEICSIDFKLDTDRIKKDISHLTKNFLKSKKLK